MADNFHNTEFHDTTQLKLDLFRGYIREWLPVFLTQKQNSPGRIRHVNLYDFFAGSGYDKTGNPGSPIIVIEELKQYCQTQGDLRNSDLTIRMFLNDENQAKVKALESAVDKVRCDKGCCAAEISCLPFQQALEKHLPLISSPESANLIIMDQFGVKEVTPEIIRKLAQCSRTDLLFFISSSYIRRFIETPEMRKYYDLESQEVKDQDYNVIHRYVCAYFQEKLKDLDYCLAPFSLKKGSNIYGVIFGSASLYGLDKFLKVCWTLDPINGDSNYNINGDFAWANKGLFDEMNKISKEEKFHRELEGFLKSNSPSNQEVFRFALTHGFRPQQAVAHLRTMSLTLESLDPKRPCTTKAYYVTWKEYNEYPPRIRFSLKESE